MKYAKVAFDIALDRVFDYEVPDELKAKARPGFRVVAPFGRTSRTGIIVERSKVADFDELKEIKEVPDDFALVTAGLMPLAKWISHYWIHPLGQVLSAFVPSGVRTSKKAFCLPESEELCAAAPATGAKGPELTKEQKNALVWLTPAITDKKFEVSLIHGVTGSGKTEVYMRAIALCLEQGRQAILIVPEISLTPQMEERFSERFPNNISLFHSRMTIKQRREHWLSFRHGKSAVAIGARSAVFAPAQNLGLIIVDEEHEKSFKQEEGLRYHARDTSVMRAKLENVPVILGSATPSVESYANVSKGKYKLLNMPTRAGAMKEPKISIVDMNTEQDVQRKNILLSRRLTENIRKTLGAKRQVLLFLNRRGFSTSCMCEDCGWEMSCAQCSVMMTFHKTLDRAYCHMCGMKAEMPKKCPECSNKKLSISGTGTQKVEAFCRRTFPEARIRRIDTDSMKKTGAFEQIYKDVLNRRVDILIGTQMLAKGLHFPGLALAGIISADSALHIPDFRAMENTFQTILQVAGRAGRSEEESLVIVQTRSMDAATAGFLLAGDYDSFVERELENRKLLHYPPFGHFVRIVVAGIKEEHVEEACLRLHQKIQAIIGKNNLRAQISEPGPAMLLKKRNLLRWNIMIKTVSVMNLAEKIRPVVLEQDRSRRVRIYVDVDPFSML